MKKTRRKQSSTNIIENTNSTETALDISNETASKPDTLQQEDKFYIALGHEIRRNIMKFIGNNHIASFTDLKRELQISTGTLYHHLEVLDEMISQDETKEIHSHIFRHTCIQFFDSKSRDT